MDPIKRLWERIMHWFRGIIEWVRRLLGKKRKRAGGAKPKNGKGAGRWGKGQARCAHRCGPHPKADASAFLNPDGTEVWSPMFENSPDGVYIWLDDDNKVCNKRLANIFGYTVDEWRATEPFLESFVDEEDQHTYSSNYQMCVAPLARPVTFRFRGRRKDAIYVQC